MTLTAKDVAEISRLLEESNFDELDLELDGLKLTLRRSGASPPVEAQSAAPAAPLVAAAIPEGASSHEGPAAAASTGPSAAQEESDRQALSVTAPLLGTFYRAPKPGAPPFVEVGSPVEHDTIIGIIEVMKLMNTVRAGARGKVVDILAKDGALVEYGETLMRVSQGEAQR